MVTWARIAHITTRKEELRLPGPSRCSQKELLETLYRSLERPRSPIISKLRESIVEESGRQLLTREAIKAHLKWERIIMQDAKWISLRRSFIESEEWREFRARWLRNHPACARCGKTSGLLQVHHTGYYTLDYTVLDEGFLEGLKHPERFETVCGDCHKKEHEGLIWAEKAQAHIRSKKGI